MTLTEFLRSPSYKDSKNQPFLNQWADFDQSCIDKLLGGCTKLSDFSDLDFIFKHFKMSILTKIGFLYVSLE